MESFAPNNTPFPPLIAAKDGSNFTYTSLHDRVPHILTDVINDFYAAIQSRTDSDEAVAEGKQLTSALSRLKHEMVTDKLLTPLEEDGVGDTAKWNSWLAKYFPQATWYSAPFLVWEPYLYRRIAMIFKRSQYWNTYDFFASRKKNTFIASMVAVAKLCARVDKLTRECLEDPSTTKLHLAFIEMLQASLWGNQTDLSMFPDLSNERLEEMQAQISSGENNSKIVSNDTDKIWSIVSRISKGRVDIVLDNSGFELLQDVLLAHWLVSVGIAQQIVFHPKRIPWYVSDVTNQDFYWLINALQDPQSVGASGLSSSDEAVLKSLGNQWSSLLASNVWVLKDELFWTGPYGYRYLPSEGSDTWMELVNADCVIFKGDLNYRKLIYDLQWPVSTPFIDAIGPIATDPNAPAVVSLRTAKCDTIVGVDPQRARELFALRKDWMYSGEYGVIQLSPGRWN
ncbi:Hairy/enhancer-of-split with YRPW motif protein 2 [Coemansia sp. RSA 1290]|nr:Hairy/enhancer-of-split with YRPW motif protein 2 [Coemansia sp. RSA 1290]KAJ2653413.1 Hairy/enhancer-of-split with YRPW motif protein 2 [Coemansia sp. RSA 1250]